MRSAPKRLTSFSLPPPPLPPFSPFPGSFDLLIYTDKDSEVPLEWYVDRERERRDNGWGRAAQHFCSPLMLSRSPLIHLFLSLYLSPSFSPHGTLREDSDARLIEDSENVRLRSFSTKVHRVDTMVSYRADGAGADLC